MGKVKDGGGERIAKVFNPGVESMGLSNCTRLVSSGHCLFDQLNEICYQISMLYDTAYDSRRPLGQLEQETS